MRLARRAQIWPSVYQKPNTRTRKNSRQLQRPEPSFLLLLIQEHGKKKTLGGGRGGGGGRGLVGFGKGPSR